MLRLTIPVFTTAEDDALSDNFETETAEEVTAADTEGSEAPLLQEKREVKTVERSVEPAQLRHRGSNAEKSKTKIAIDDRTRTHVQQQKELQDGLTDDLVCTP